MKHLVWLSLGLLLFVRIFYYYSKTQPSFANGTKIRITGRVTSEPIRYTNYQYFKLQGFKIYLTLYPEVRYGDIVVLEGIVDNDNLKSAKLIKIKESEGIIYNLRKNLIEFYETALPQPHSSLIAGVTIGSKGSIPEYFWQSLIKTGTAHVVVASGMNVTLISSFLISFLAILLPRRKAIPLALIGVWSYAILSGFDAPIIRAAIMGSLVFIAQEVGRLSFSFRTLILTAFAMIFAKPDFLFDKGFHLSFAATLSLILFEGKIDSYLKKFFSGRTLLRLPEFVRKDFSTSLSAQLGVAPILFWGFGQINIFSPIVNTLIAWTIVPMTIIGMTAGLVSFLSESFARLILWLSYPLTSWFTFVVERL